MPKYKPILRYSDGTVLDDDDELFDTEEEALDYGGYLVSCTHLGAEICHWSNPGDNPPDDPDDDPEIEIIEVDD